LKRLGRGGRGRGVGGDKGKGRQGEGATRGRGDKGKGETRGGGDKARGDREKSYRARGDWTRSDRVNLKLET